SLTIRRSRRKGDTYEKVERAEGTVKPASCSTNAGVGWLAARPVSRLRLLAPGIAALAALCCPQAARAAGLSPELAHMIVPGADQVWSGTPGFRGSGIRIAVLDTGVNDQDNDFDVATGRGSRVVAWKDLVANRPKPYDDNGHGTHVAGIVLGNGSDSSGPGNS